MKTTRQQQDATRRQIVASAVDLMTRQGFDGTTMKDIARAAGIGDSDIKMLVGGQRLDRGAGCRFIRHIRDRKGMGDAPVFVVVPDLLDHLRATFNPTSGTSYDDLFSRVRSAPILILDDLGTQSATPWA